MPDYDKIIDNLWDAVLVPQYDHTGDMWEYPQYVQKAAYDAIQAINELAERIKWISVKDRLPEEKISPLTLDWLEYPCIFQSANGEREVRYYKFGRGHFWLGFGEMDHCVVAWAERMPLPEEI